MEINERAEFIYRTLQYTQAKMVVPISARQDFSNSLTLIFSLGRIHRSIPGIFCPSRLPLKSPMACKRVFLMAKCPRNIAPLPLFFSCQGRKKTGKFWGEGEGQQSGRHNFAPLHPIEVWLTSLVKSVEGDHPPAPFTVPTVLLSHKSLLLFG